MPSVGLVGGLGPESTTDYYRRILEAALHVPAIIMRSRRAGAPPADSR